MDQSAILMLLGLVMVIAFLAQTIKPDHWQVQKSILVALMIAGFAGYVAQRHHQGYVKAQEEAKRRADLEGRVSRFAESHDAVRDWEKQLEPKVRVFNADLSPVLVRQDGRPIFSIVSVDDVAASDGGNVISFKDYGHFSPTLRLRLNCTSEQAHLAMTKRFGRYALVAQVNSIDSKDVDAAGHAFLLANGSCVDLMSYEE